MTNQYLFIQWLLLYNRFEGKDYPIYSRKKESFGKEIMFDCELAKGKNTSI
jgi:hypothetical protein